MRTLFLKHTPFVLALFTLMSTHGEKSLVKETSPKDSVDKPNEQIIIDTFTKFPPEIDGCACSFSNNNVEFQKKKYVFVNDYGDVAFVSINGVMTQFEHKKQEILSSKHSIDIYANDNYEITIDIKQIGQKGETWQQKGILKIKSMTGKEVIKNIYGECGC